jgi:hypothetical protein
MPTFAVRFKGMLNKSELERLDRRKITIEAEEPSLRIGTIMTGVPIYTVHVEADSEEEALRLVRATLEPDTGNFSEWETGPA